MESGELRGSLSLLLLLLLLRYPNNADNIRKLPLPPFFAGTLLYGPKDICVDVVVRVYQESSVRFSFPVFLLPFSLL